MIGLLPTTLNINGKDYEIRSDFRECLLILQAFQDPELNNIEATDIMLGILFKDPIPEEDLQEACDKAIWFLDGGGAVKESNTKRHKKPLYNFEQDESIIFSAINKVAGKEVRTEQYLHFWTFIGLFNEIGESVFSTVVSIRNKRNKGEKLDKAEREFYRDNKELVDLKKHYTEEEQREIDEITQLLG